MEIIYCGEVKLHSQLGQHLDQLASLGKKMDKMFSTILSNLFIVLMMEQLVSLEIIVGETFIPTVLMI